MESINKKQGKRKKRILNKIITIFLLILILILFGTMIYLNVIPIKNILIIFLITILITFLLILCNFSKKRGFRLT